MLRTRWRASSGRRWLEDQGRLQEALHELTALKVPRCFCNYTSSPAVFVVA